MMQMLEAGGMPILTDHVRKADDDNPRGYYELEQAKKIDRETDWLNEAKGRAFKMVSVLLPRLPPTCEYRILFMKRNLREVLQSQTKMLARLGKPGGMLSSDLMISAFSKNLKDVESWLVTQPNIKTAQFDYAATVADPLATAQRVAAFLGLPLDQSGMAAAVDAGLYRNRASYSL